jgi:predicted nucleotidyltransferase
MAALLVTDQVVHLATDQSAIPAASESAASNGPTFTAAVTDTLIQMTGSSAVWGDYDNDGDLDILVTGMDGSSTIKAFVYRNDGADTFTEVVTDTLIGIIYGSAEWGDYDNDGDLDILLAGGRYGSSSDANVYRNDGGDNFTLTISDTLRDLRSTSAAWGDYDNDGDLDILFTGHVQGAANPFAAVYRNDGSGVFFSAVTTDTLTGVHKGSGVWGDYDNDGDLDILLVGCSAGEISCTARTVKVFRNDGSDSFIDIGASLVDLLGADAEWGDYDNDGDLDILLSGSTGATRIARVFRNDGSDLFTQAVTDTLAGVSPGSVAWGDYDNDGDLDILLTGDTPTGPFSAVYRNDGSDTFTPAITDTITNVSHGSAAWGDYDNDGDLDILLTGCASVAFCDTRYTAIYRNELITTIAPYAPPAPPSSLSSDVSGQTVELSWAAPPATCTTPIPALTYNLYVGSTPGGVDVAPPMAFTPPDPHPSGLRLLPAFGNAQHGLTATLRLPYGTYYWSVQAIDHTFAGSAFATEGSFTVTPPPFTAVITDQLTAVRYGSVAWGDYDNDGDLDILLTGQTGDKPAGNIYRNDGSDTFTELTIGTQVGVYQGSVAWGDYDGDNDLDILYTGYSGTDRHTVVHRNDGGDAFNEAVTDTLENVSQSSVAWGDYDNDGDLDILLTGFQGSDPISVVYRNDGYDSKSGDWMFTAAITDTLIGVMNSSVTWGDYDNDDDLDILITGHEDTEPFSIVYRNDGADGSSGEWTFTAAVSSTMTGVHFSSVAWGDYDNDGDLDALVSGYYDDIVEHYVTTLYRNEGADSFSVAVTDTLAGVSNGTAAWGDYDNDGDLDILLTGYYWDGGHRYVAAVYRNDGGDVFVTAVTTDTLTGVSDSSAAWGDYDGDGDLDILLTGYSGSRRHAIVYRNNTTTENMVPAAPSGLVSQVSGDSVVLSWSAPPPTCTTPFNGLTYNLYVGTAPGQVNAVPPMAFTVTHPLTNGLRLLPALGNAQLGLSARLTLPPSTYYWSVQAVDHTFAGSPFAAEGQFIIYEHHVYLPLALRNYP